MIVNFKLKDTSVKVPYKASVGSTGYDICSNEETIIKVGQIKLIKTGLYCSFPKGFDMQIRSRSGISLKHGVSVLNSPGTVDSDYRDEIGVILINHGDKEYEIKKGDRIAQIVFVKCIEPDIKVITNISDNSNRNGGFGSTGK